MAVTIGLPSESAYDFSARRESSAPRDSAAIDAEVRHVERAMKAVVEDVEATPARDAASYHLASGGGRTRARLAIASGLGWGMPFRHRVAAAAACELLHNASLVHDDISDADTMRRGQPTVWHRYGRDIALCTGDLLLTGAFLVATTIDDTASSQELVRQLAQQSSRVIGGQTLELATRGGGTTYSVMEYIRATCAKTAPMFELPLRAGAIASRMATPTARDLRRLSEAVGLAYQILDDLDDMPPARDAAQQHLHRLHAWHRHRSGAHGSAAPNSAIRQRCVRHARAALDRAMALSRELPMPLEMELYDLIRRLTVKADDHAAADLSDRGSL